RDGAGAGGRSQPTTPRIGCISGLQRRAYFRRRCRPREAAPVPNPASAAAGPCCAVGEKFADWPCRRRRGASGSRPLQPTYFAIRLCTCGCLHSYDPVNDAGKALGNPGEKYQSTRHNVGFDMIDAFADSQNISLTKNHFKALFGEGMVDGVPVLLAKPQTYINLSGESAGALAAYYKLPLHRVVVAYDDTDLPCGVLRLQPKGGYGRHNGLSG
uniref:Peptidyl-tRNA hydrolase n=1 Tax=Aegilops tauschii subsp. strangulata TaxID=200361 RepID=A0A453DE23_AEGTS